MLNGRLEPTGVVDGFTADLSASGSFCPKHITLPVTAFFFKLSDDNAPSPYLVGSLFGMCTVVLLGFALIHFLASVHKWWLCFYRAT